MSHWTTNTEVNRTCPLRRVIRTEARDVTWGREYLECGHSAPNYIFRMGKVGQKRRCLECRAEAVQSSEVKP